MSKEMEGKVAVITGGTSGIGLGIALACLEDGMKVVITGRNAERMEKALERLRSIDGAEVDALQLDATKLEDHKKLAQFALDKYGHLDMAFNNAASAFHRLVDNMTDKDWEYIFRANFGSVIAGMRTYLPIFDSQETGGYLCNIASVGGLFPPPTMSGYSATKAAMINMTEAAYYERAMMQTAPNTHISIVCPNSVVSNLEKNAEESRPIEFREEVDNRTEFDKQVAAQLAAQTTEEAAKTMEGTITFEEAGKIILEGVKAQRLYIFTHPEATAAIIQQRVNTMISGYPSEVEF